MDELFNNLPAAFRPTILKHGNLEQLGRHTEQFTDLPIFEIIKYCVDSYGEHEDRAVFMLNGKTGSGKSLCVAPFLYAHLRGEYNIILAEPKIDLAIKLANDIARWNNPLLELGENVGYRTSTKSLGRRAKNEGGIDVVTTGVALKLMSEGIKSGENDNRVYIIDEVHDKGSGNVDLCFNVAANAIADGHKIFVLFMSATIDSDSIIKLFREIITDVLTKKATTKHAIREINNYSMFPEAIIGLPKFFNNVITVSGDVNKRINYFLKEDSSNIMEDCIDTIVRAKYERTSEEYIWNNNPNGDVIIFLPGRAYIDGFAAYFESKRDLLGDFVIVKATSVNLRDNSGNVYRINTDIKPYGVSSREYKIVLATNVFEAGITLANANIVIITCLINSKIFIPISDSSMVMLTPISVSSKEQEDGRTGRVIPGISKCLTTKHTYKLLDYNPSPVTREELTSYILHKAATAPWQIADLFFPSADPVNFNNLMVALKRITAWGLINIKTGAIEPIGKFLLTMMEAKLEINQAMIIALSRGYKLPVSIGILLALYIEQKKFIPVFKRPTTKLDSFEEMYNEVIELLNSDDPKYDQQIFGPYLAIKNHMAKQNLRSDYGIGNIYGEDTKISPEDSKRFYKRAIKIMKIVYFNGRADLDGEKKNYITNNNNRIPIKNIYLGHINKTYKESSPPSSIYVVDYIKLKLQEFTIPIPHLIFIA